jgi:hypothetical protein
MARIVEAAWTSSAEWGLYVWLSAVLGARRGEVVALQWEDVDVAAGVVRLDENCVRTNDGMGLLTAGVDLRTVAGRLGHGDGTTTLRHYAAWVSEVMTSAGGPIRLGRHRGSRRHRGPDAHPPTGRAVVDLPNAVRNARRLVVELRRSSRRWGLLGL